MRFPREYIAATFLPSLRLRIAHHLRAKGKSQNEIANLLGVKQPVVVSYLKKNIKDSGDEKINHHIDSLSETISSLLVAEESIEPIMRTVCTKCKSLRVNGPICSVHKNLLPELSSIQDCTICSGFDKLPSLKNRSIVLNSMTESLNELKTIDEFVEWIPEIGTQLVSCTERANDLDDIASFPGRIIKVKDEIMTVSKPEFGSSKTMSSLLLWIGKSQPNIRWILSLKNKAKLLELLKKKNIPFLETSELDIKWDKTLAKLSKNPKISNIKILLDNASSGYESIAYLFAESEKKLSALLRDVIT